MPRSLCSPRWGWWRLFRRGRFEAGGGLDAGGVAVFLVNLSYPEWTGGWSTGPRLLVPLLPFAMLPVAAVLAETGHRGRVALWLAIVLGLAGAVLMLLFQGVGARIPHFVADPLFEVVLPLWRGAELPPWWTGERLDFGDERRRFARNLVSLAFEQRLSSLPAPPRRPVLAPGRHAVDRDDRRLEIGRQGGRSACPA